MTFSWNIPDCPETTKGTDTPHVSANAPQTNTVEGALPKPLKKCLVTFYSVVTCQAPPPPHPGPLLSQHRAWWDVRAHHPSCLTRWFPWRHATPQLFATHGCCREFNRSRNDTKTGTTSVPTKTADLKRECVTQLTIKERLNPTQTSYDTIEPSQTQRQSEADGKRMRSWSNISSIHSS